MMQPYYNNANTEVGFEGMEAYMFLWVSRSI